jgi:hypothetical protein
MLVHVMQVVATLKQLASAGHTVVCSIYQPRSSIFACRKAPACLAACRA